MIVEGDEIYMVGKMYNLKLIMVEKEDYVGVINYDMKFKKFEEVDGIFKYYFVVLIKKFIIGINSF